MDYQAKLSTPLGVLGIRCSDEALSAIDFLPESETCFSATNELAAMTCAQLLHYLRDPRMRFEIPLELSGTAHQNKVWCIMQSIPCGQTRSYGELAAELKSAAQAVGQACGANPIPIIVPCHRVIGKAGLGGFMQHGSGASLELKRWLLQHEGAL